MKNNLIFLVSILALFLLLGACTEPDPIITDYRLKDVGIYNFTVYRQLYQMANDNTTTYDTMYHTGVINLYNLDDESNNFFPSNTPTLNIDSALTIYFLPETHITTKVDNVGNLILKISPASSNQSGNIDDNGNINLTVDFWPSRAFHDTYTIVGEKVNQY
jgi:hypothetical protein